MNVSLEDLEEHWSRLEQVCIAAENSTLTDIAVNLMLLREERRTFNQIMRRHLQAQFAKESK